MYVSSWPGLSPAHLLGRRPAAPAPFPLDAGRRIFTYVARGAIYHLARALVGEGRRIFLMPDYHSGAEVWAVRAAGAAVRVYHVNRRMEIDLDEIRDLCAGGPRVLYLIHYLGWPQPVAEIAALCRETGAILIEDCALALWSAAGGRPLGSFGDYAVFCLYKTVPVPHGGLLVGRGAWPDALQRLALRPPGALSVAARAAELGVEWIRERARPLGAGLAAAKRGGGRLLDRLGARRLPVADIDPDFAGAGYDVAATDVGMARLCAAVLARIDAAGVVRARRRNYALLAARLAPRVRPLLGDPPPGACPLFFPILVPDKAALARALRDRGIGAVEVWNYGHPALRPEEGRDAAHLRAHLLEIPIHQGLSAERVHRMADAILDLLPG
jgi:dTDP-4-amino-4,6-dideoxygalactose transaminase